MDPVMLVAAAVAAGAAARLTEPPKRELDDAYRRLTEIIVSRYGSVDLTVVETRPESESRRLVLAEELQRIGAGADGELLTAARHLLRLIEDRESSTAGIQLTRIQAGEVEITDVVSDGPAVAAEDLSLTGRLRIDGARAGGEPIHPPVARRQPGIPRCQARLSTPSMSVGI
ncbi:hypothetical protein [Nocardia bovistercoris]|uniref:RHIM domain-containing protein n=1 Tax=Nocardia bovistercoris TaxID=2785916 RepID=A0A931IEA6_9NOCA|nr:hypothetical protein [Nocardia bovistercoris]MBH0779849.1 hypothetical protein [Nocardia bovistercoris]